LVNPWPKIKTQRSLNILTTTRRSDDDLSDLSSPSSSEETVLDSPITDEEVISDKEKFDVNEKDYFRLEKGMRYHPFPLEDAPYMQAYDRSLLDK
jgi:hypothetical protein